MRIISDAENSECPLTLRENVAQGMPAVSATEDLERPASAISSSTRRPISDAVAVSIRIVNHIQTDSATWESYLFGLILLSELI